MGIKCILLYKLPKGTSPTTADQERIKAALTEQLCCIPEGRGHASKDGVLEALVHVFAQNKAPDESALTNIVYMTDVWQFKLAKDGSNKTYLMLRKDGVPSVTEADGSIRSFLERRLDYRLKQTMVIKSNAWSMGDKHSDVTIKLLQVSRQNFATQGLALEVTYHPACVLAAAWPVLAELSQRIINVVGPEGPGQPGSLALLHPEYSSFKVDTTNNNMELPPMFGPIHTVVAYKQLLEEATGMR